MYGDCEVMPSSMMGTTTSVVPTDPLFSSTSSSSPMISTKSRNPNPNNLGFVANIPFHSFSSIIPKEEGPMLVVRSGKEEEMETGSMGSAHVDGGGISDHDVYDDPQEHHNGSQLHPSTAKKKRYHRHTARQIQEMEALFKECPHPDDKQRMKLSQELGLKPRQVKFWFQNRRTQMKAQQDRSDNSILHAENDTLKSDNYRLQSAIRNVVCPNCGGPAMLGEISLEEEHLRLENARLKDELERLSCIAARFGGRQMAMPPPLLMPSLDLDMSMYSRMCEMIPVGAAEEMVVIREEERGTVLNLAMIATAQLARMCRAGGPLWLRSRAGDETEVLNVGEYDLVFQWPVDFKRQSMEYRTEATRDSTVVFMNSISLVDAFMDANKWMELFPSIVSEAKTLQILTPGISGHGIGSLQLMYAEFHVLSPLVPTREVYFLRYCQKNAEEGTWTVVDFPIDGFQGGLQLMPFPRCRRRPSGCIMQDLSNGYTRVMWVEHVEVEHQPVHQAFNQFVNCGMAFGATRWLSILNRQCERLASLMARNIPDPGVFATPEGRKNMMKLSQRMVKTFCSNIISSGNHSWTALSERSDDSIRVITRKSTDPGQPNAVILTAVSTTWMPFSHNQVFDLLTDLQRRSQLDLVSNGNSLQEVGHIANGSHPRNRVSLLRTNSTGNSSHQKVELVLQESSTHTSGGSLVVYASVNVDAVQFAISGEDPTYTPLLPIGFVIFPAPSPHNEADPTGCILTVGSQILASATSLPKLNLSSVTAVSGNLSNVVQRITDALSGDGPAGSGGGTQPDIVASIDGPEP